MKKTGSILLILFLCSLSFAGNKEIASTIKEVTVFTTGAQVKRNASINLTSGKTHLVFTNITSLLKKESLEITGEGDFRILSINHQIEYDYSSPSIEKVNSLKKEIEEIGREEEEINNEIYVNQKEIKLIEAIEKLTLEYDTLDIPTIINAQEIYHDKLLQLKTKYLNFNQQLTQLQKRKTSLQAELQGLKIKKSNPRSEIHVLVSCKKPVNASFNISYYVLNARWYPEYNIRVKNVSEPFELDYKAMVNQQTGEDWNDVKLTLSTSEPNKPSQKPKLNKWQIALNNARPQQHQNRNNYNRFSGTQLGAVRGTVIDEYGDPIPFANVIVSGTTIGTTTDFDGNFSLTLPQGANHLTVSYVGYTTVQQPIQSEVLQIVMAENTTTLEAVQISNVRGARSNMKANAIRSVDGIVSTRTRKVRNKKFQATKNNYPVSKMNINVVDVAFDMDDQYTILSSVENQTIQINSLQVPATYQYYCAPKIDKDVFLTALITDWEQYHLLEGKTSIFYEGTYIGTSLMNVRYVSDTLDISLGRDRNIQVKREKTKDYKRKELLGSDIIEDRKWNIAIKNNKSFDINIIVEDQVPVANDKRIAIKQEHSADARINKDDGIITWDLKVKPLKVKDIQFKYSVTYPNGFHIYLE